MEKLKRERANFLVLGHPFGPFRKAVLTGEECQRHVEESIKTVTELSSKVLEVLYNAKKPMNITEMLQELPNTWGVTVGSILERLLSKNIVSKSKGKDTFLWSAKI